MPTVSMIELHEQIVDLQRQIGEAEDIRRGCRNQDDPVPCLKASGQEIARLQLLLNAAQQEIDTLSRIVGTWVIIAQPDEFSAELAITAWDPKTFDLDASLRQKGNTTDSGLSFASFNPGDGTVFIEAPPLVWFGTLNQTQPVMTGIVEGVSPFPTWGAGRQRSLFVPRPPVDILQ